MTGCPLAPATAVAALYEACEDAAGRVALDQAWAEFRGFTLPGPRDDDDLGRAIDSNERGTS